MSAFPPHRLIESVPVSQEVALKYLSAYLEATKTSPHLLPNARLEPSGPTSGSTNSSIVIHNLQRVEAGLRGEWLAPKLDLEESVKITEGMDDGTNKGQAVTNEKEGEGWMDLDQYQREQSIEGGEINSAAANFMGQEGDSDLDDERERRQENADDGIVDEEGGEDEVDTPATRPSKKVKTKHVEIPKKTVNASKDKETRKKEKKERLKAEQVARAKAKLAGSN